MQADAAVGDEVDPETCVVRLITPRSRVQIPPRYQGQRPLPITGGPFSMPNANLLAGWGGQRGGTGQSSGIRPGPFGTGELEVNYLPDPVSHLT